MICNEVNMKGLLIYCCLCMQVVSGVQAIADDSASYLATRKALYEDLEKPLGFWLAELASSEIARRERARIVLAEAAGIVIFADLKQIKTSWMLIEHLSFANEEIPGEEKITDLANRYRTEFRVSLDATIDQLAKSFTDKESPDRCEVIDSLASCIAVSYPDGTGIIRARRRLPASFESDELICLFFRYSAWTIPADKPLHPIVISEIRELSDETNAWLDCEWDRVKDTPWAEKPFEGMLLGWVPMAVFSGGLSQRGGALSELPLLTELIKSEYPELIRCASLVCLSEFSFFAEPVLPVIRELLTDEAPLIRRFAAEVVVCVAIDECDLEELADTAGIHGTERQEFITESRETIDTEFSDIDLSIIEKVIRDEDEGDQGLIQLNSSKLISLRKIRHFRRRAQHLESFVRECLNDSDRAVRRSAELAIKAIELPGPEPKNLRPLSRSMYK